MLMTNDIDPETGVPVGRTCSKCGEWKTLDAFNKKAKGKYGVNNECRECQRVSNKLAYDKNPKPRIEAAKARRQANPGERKAWDAAYRERNPQKVKDAVKKHYENNPEAWERKKATAEQWRRDNPDRVKEIKIKSQKKRSKKAEVRIHSNVSRAIRSGLAKGRKEGKSTFDILGYTREKLMEHLEKQFEPGMSWDNYGLHGWHIDHIIPKVLFHFQAVTDIDFKRCWALDNLRPMWATDNRKKHAKYSGTFQPSLALALT